MDTLNNPPPMAGSNAVWTGTEMIVWDCLLYAGCKYNLLTDTWSWMSNTGSLSVRINQAVVLTGEIMIIFGGVDSNDFDQMFNTRAKYTPTTDSWSTLTTTSSPIDRYEHKAVDLLTNKILNMNNTATQLTASDNNLKVVHVSNDRLSKSRFFIYHDKFRKLIDTSSIVMIQSTSNYSTIYLDNGEKIFTSRTLKYWEELFNCVSLMRIHRSYLINHLKISSIQNNKVFLPNNLIATVSRELKKAIRTLLIAH